MTTRLTALALVVGLVLAGCGSTQGAPPARTAPAATASTAATAATVEDNERLADQEAARLATLTSVPPESTETDTPPTGLTGVPHILMDGGQAVVTRYWQVATPFQDVLGWLKAHPPEGLSLRNSFTGNDQSGYAYREPAAAAWDTAALQIVASPIDAHTTGIRADATVIWLDPTPVRDNRAGPRMHITVAGGCPASDAHVVGVEALRSDLSDQLVPPGDPAGGLICRYHGLNGTRNALASSQRLDAPSALRLADALRALRLSHRAGTYPISCPAMDGSVTVVVLSYPSQPDVPLWVSVGGCGRVSNGVIATTDAGKLRETLDALQQG